VIKIRWSAPDKQLTHKGGDRTVHMLAGLTTAHLQLVLALHERGVLDKDEIATQLEKIAQRTGDQSDPGSVLLLAMVAELRGD
jgi:hypothetical protein